MSRRFKIVISYFLLNKRNNAKPATPNTIRLGQLIPIVAVHASVLELDVESQVNGLQAEVKREVIPGRLQYQGQVPLASGFTADPAADADPVALATND